MKASVDDPTAARGRGTIVGASTRFEFDRRTMAQFADTLALEVDRPVIDRTGLAGTYDIRLEFTPLRRSAVLQQLVGILPEAPSVPTLFTALTEQLGLKLEPGRGPVTVLVVDSALRQPTGN